MFNKSGQSTLDTLKEILSDVKLHSCERKEKSNESWVYNVGKHQRHYVWQSKHRKALHNLLEEYRSTILPNVIYNWTDLDETEKKLCSKLNNFFCGLHLLVDMVDSCETSITKFEMEFNDGKNIGSAACLELKRYHRNASGVLRLLRISSWRGWKKWSECAMENPFRTKKGENQIIRFKHNRFYLVFLLEKKLYTIIIRPFLCSWRQCMEHVMPYWRMLPLMQKKHCTL